MDYRREIDGLRALAVLPVILFHAGFETFSGGFVGVDIFFVISGYLITTIIIEELGQGRFSIVNFYERRARRIFPALFLVIFICIPFAWLWLLPNDMKNFSRSLVAIPVFASNILFWHESGYFDTSAELKPLLHTWSLAVEEQYYVFFPLFLILLWRFGKQRIFILLVAICIFSFALAQWGSLARPAAAFFLLPTRAWELLIGAITAFYLSRTDRTEFNRSVGEIGGYLGLVLILFSIFIYSKATPFPGFYALIPTVGSVLIVLFATQQTTVGKVILGNKAFVKIGLISYSAYLWHQPLFAFARHKSLLESQSQPNENIFVFLTIVSLIIAYASRKYIENPFRSKKKLSKKTIFFSIALASIFLILVGIFGIYSQGYSSRLPENITYQSLGAKLDKNGDICEPKKSSADYEGLLICEFGDLSSVDSVILYGDSHARAISEELSKSLLSNNIKGIWVQIIGCEVIPQIHNTSNKANLFMDCTNRFENFLRFVKDKKASVVVVSRWTFSLYPIDDIIVDMPSKNSEGGIERDADYREYAALMNGGLFMDENSKETALRSFLEGLLRTNMKIIVVYPTPEIAQDIARANFKYFSYHKELLREISIPHSDYTFRNKFVIRIFDSYEYRDNFYSIKPENIFCDTYLKGRCVAQFNYTPYYYDDDHLSDAGAQLIINKFIENIK